MATKKYISDYRMENVLDEKTGKLRTVPVYRGDLYSFISSEEDVKKGTLIFVIATVTAFVVLVATLLVNARCARVIYVSLPVAALVFPVYGCMASMLRLLNVKEQVSREHSDKLAGRYTSSSFFMMLLSGISVIGHIVYICLGRETWPDELFLIGAAVIFACGAVMFLNRKLISMEKTGSAKIVYDDED